MQQEVLLALMSKEPSYGYEMQARLRDALGADADGVSAGQIYVTLKRLETAGLATSRPVGDHGEGRDRRVYEVTPAGRDRVVAWLADTQRPSPDLADLHLKLVAAAAAGITDPLDIIDVQRRHLMQRLATTQRSLIEADESPSANLLLEGVAIRLEADLRWLDACERRWRKP